MQSDPKKENARLRRAIFPQRIPCSVPSSGVQSVEARIVTWRCLTSPRRGFGFFRRLSRVGQARESLTKPAVFNRRNDNSAA